MSVVARVVAIDVGGTFTDVTVVDGDVIRHMKTLTDAAHPEAVINRILSVVDGDGSALVLHGSTIATNLLVQKRLPPVALLTTEGFRDVLEIGRLSRPPELQYNLLFERPDPLVPRELRFEVHERVDAAGVVLSELDSDEVRSVASRIAATGVTNVAVVLLFSFLNPSHEERVAVILEREYGLEVCESHDVSNERGEYERTTTTVVNAGLRPVIRTYLERLRASRALFVMQSNAGLNTVAEAVRRPANMLLSGPTGGLIAGRAMGELLGAPNLVTADMGGTSFDVGLITDGRVGLVRKITVAGAPVLAPAVNMHTIGAGGGSIAWRDTVGLLRVGPHSAGAMPGPACYGLGGEEPTVTDANVSLGLIPDGLVMSDSVTVSRDLAVRSLERLGQELDMDCTRVAQGIRRVANEQMAAAIRQMTVARGTDVRDYDLLIFGGAGPLHGAEIGEILGVSRVFIPFSAGVLSTVGFLLSELRLDEVQPVTVELASSDAGTLLARAMDFISHRLAGRLTGVGSASLRFWADLRYRGQGRTLEVPIDQYVDAHELVDEFQKHYREAYGYELDARLAECVGVRGVASAPACEVSLTSLVDSSHHAVDRKLQGPRVIAEAGYTIWVPPRFTLESGPYAYVLRREEG